jgi:hypothetical protein
MFKLYFLTTYNKLRDIFLTVEKKNQKKILNQYKRPTLNLNCTISSKFKNHRYHIVSFYDNLNSYKIPSLSLFPQKYKQYRSSHCFYFYSFIYILFNKLPFYFYLVGSLAVLILSFILFLNFTDFSLLVTCLPAEHLLGTPLYEYQQAVDATLNNFTSQFMVIYTHVCTFYSQYEPNYDLRLYIVRLSVGIMTEIVHFLCPRGMALLLPYNDEFDCDVLIRFRPSCTAVYNLFIVLYTPGSKWV